RRPGIGLEERDVLFHDGSFGRCVEKKPGPASVLRKPRTCQQPAEGGLLPSPWRQFQCCPRFSPSKQRFFTPRRFRNPCTLLHTRSVDLEILWSVHRTH